MKKLLALALPLLLLASCSDQKRHRIIILGIDGMDYGVTRELLDQGQLPNLAALAKEGGFSALGTSIPPESPVAWSNFITGENPGGHGVFDFLHPSWKKVGEGEYQFEPVDSIAGSTKDSWVLPILGYRMPLSPGEPINKRQGTAFWELLEDHDIPATIFKIPANYPPTPTDQQTLSGMGTPDAQGGYGTYYLYTDNPFAVSDRISAGKLITVSIYDNVVRDVLYGPVNTLRAVKEGEKPPTTTVPLRVDLDPEQPVVRIMIGDPADNNQVVLREGEWSDFLEANFDIIPHMTGVTGQVRFCLQEVRPTFKLFVDPINVSPLTPAFDISTPADWVTELAKRDGPFMTKGMPENTKALEEGVLTYDEMRKHSLMIYEQRKKMLFDLLPRQESGLLFHYFSSIDLNSHMFWRCMDKNHPGHDPNVSPENEQFIQYLYEDIDKVVGQVRQQIRPDDTLIVMSDHGFAPFYRKFNLNTWLLENGYIHLKPDADRKQDPGVFLDVDWSKTRAYNIGFACIYLNVRGTEDDPMANGHPMGIVDPTEVDPLVDEICMRLMKEKDPKNGEPIFLTMYKTRDDYSGRAKKTAPQIVVGFRKKYRNSNESAMGHYPLQIIEDNMEAWSGCHLMAAEEVPGVVFSNRKIALEDPKLYDLTATILSEYGIKKPEEMVGRPLWGGAPGP
ncbi:MAG: alkaline phosphatase family protein [Planctomycetota bacterium]